jgi:hypothetical protein
MWLNRVGLSHVSKDWRITFFSSDERICSQGLRTVVGVVANDIEKSLPAPGPTGRYLHIPHGDDNAAMAQGAKPLRRNKSKK